MDTVDPIDTLMTPRRVTAAEFRSTCALFPTGVTVVTRLMRDGRPYGMTVSSFTSVSLDPPLILICIDRRGAFVADLCPGVSFAVNVLRDDQQPIAVRFSTPPDLGRFSNIEWEGGETGVPLLAGTVGAFLCEVTAVVPGGDHLIVIGAVVEARRSSGQPLVWCNSGYHCLPERRPMDSPNEL